MKNFFVWLCAAMLFTACRKADLSSTSSTITDSYVQTVRAALRDSASSAQFGALDFSRAQATHIDSVGIHLLRIPFTGSDIANDFIVVQTDANGKITRGKQLHIERDRSVANVFNGSIAYTSLGGVAEQKMVVVNGYVQRSSSTVTVTTNNVRTNMMAEYDAELPEVIVYSSYSDGGGISWGDWYNLLAMLQVPNDSGGGGGGYYVSGGGGGGSNTAPAVQVDFEAPESKTAIEAKKYMNCFGSSQEANATYTITIATDIPVDNDPSKFFNWNDASPGHTYIELYKATDAGVVSQNIGFYPNTAWKAAVGGNISSKIGDDAGHEYNARYTISVSAAQFQAAISAVNAYSFNDYNISTFNCTDFALGVFNAAGGGMTIPKYDIPSFSTPGGSNTPQGLYNKLQDMAVGGNPNVQTNANKAYGGTSHGPCN